MNWDIIRLIEYLHSQGCKDFDLTQCPQVENPEIMLPLVGALRHNQYFLSITLTECQGNSQVLLMLANVVRFNSSISKLTLRNLKSGSSFIVFGDSLANNENHAVQVQLNKLLSSKKLVFNA